MVKQFFKRFLPLIVSIAENSGFIAVLLTIDNIPKNWLIGAHLVSGLIKGYFLKDAKMKNGENGIIIQDNFHQKSISPESGQSIILDRNSIINRMSFLVDALNASIIKNGGRPLEKNSVTNFIINSLIKTDEEIKKEAISKLTALERQVLGL